MFALFILDIKDVLDCIYFQLLFVVHNFNTSPE